MGGRKDALTYPSKNDMSHDLKMARSRSSLFDFHRIAYEEASHDPIFNALIMH